VRVGVDWRPVPPRIRVSVRVRVSVGVRVSRFAMVRVLNLLEPSESICLPCELLEFLELGVRVRD